MTQDAKKILTKYRHLNVPNINKDLYNKFRSMIVLHEYNVQEFVREMIQAIADNDKVGWDVMQLMMKRKQEKKIHELRKAVEDDAKIVRKDDIDAETMYQLIRKKTLRH